MNQQPKALKILFLIEMWEQYGFYTLQPLLIFFLIKKLSFPDAKAYVFSGQFAALVYLTPIIGGLLADRFFGNRIAILLGGSFLCMGYALLALGQHTFFAGLSCIILGNGLFKPNVSSFLGEFYIQNDLRREAGFTLFYMGINIGALLAMFCAGYLQELLGWGACFSVASFMLLLSMIFFRWGFRYFDNKGLSPGVHPKTAGTFLRKKPVIFLGCGIALIIIYYSLTNISLGDDSLYILAALFCLYVMKMAWHSDANARRHILALILLFAIATFYKAMFFETYFVINVFTDRLVDRSVFGHEIPASVFLSLGGLFSILLSPFWARIWQSHKIKCSIPLKFALSLLIVGAAIQMLAWLTAERQMMLSGAWIILFRLFFAISEFFILPIGPSMVTEFSPKGYTGIMMGAWFMSAALGGKLSGFLASDAAIRQGITEFHPLNIIYHHAFQHYATLNFILFFICLLLVPIIQNLLKRKKYTARSHNLKVSTSSLVK